MAPVAFATLVIAFIFYLFRRRHKQKTRAHREQRRNNAYEKPEIDGEEVLPKEFPDSSVNPVHSLSQYGSGSSYLRAELPGSAPAAAEVLDAPR